MTNYLCTAHGKLRDCADDAIETINGIIGIFNLSKLDKARIDRDTVSMFIAALSKTTADLREMIDQSELEERQAS